MFVKQQNIMNMEEKMSRRTALKTMGAAALGAVLGTSGIASLASCTGKRKRLVFYFTGTGNCLYVARQLADDDTELLSIPQLMRQKKLNFEANEIGLVYPIYGHMPPYMVRQFLKKASLKAEYTFAVLTFGARKCNAVEILDGITRKAGYRFNYVSTLMMVDNWLPNFDMDEQVRMDKHIPENLAAIKSDIDGHKQWMQPVSQEEREQHAGFMAYAGLDPEVGFLKRSEKYFVVTDRCVGCGVCTDVCPRGNYSLTGNAVKTDGDCEFCFACIQNCPQKAIKFAKVEDDPLLANGEKNPEARYRNEHVSLLDIRRANACT